MRRFFLVLAIGLTMASCQKEAVEKPENLISRETMSNIIYDLSLLQAIRSANQHVLDSNKINPSIYVYEKYKIDSLQFAQSNKYYAASDIKDYEKLYQSVSDRLVKEKLLADTLVKKADVKLREAKKAFEKDSVAVKK